MPKGLSLKKKTPQPGQSSITSFFKSGPVKPSPDNRNTETGPTVTKSAKRKATSPICASPKKLHNGPHNVDTERIPLIEILDSPSNSPPRSILGHNQISISPRNTKVSYASTKCNENPENVSEHKDKNVCDTIAKAEVQNRDEIRRSPRKHEISNQLKERKSPIKGRKKLSLEKEVSVKKNLQKNKTSPSQTAKCPEILKEDSCVSTSVSSAKLGIASPDIRKSSKASSKSGKSPKQDLEDNNQVTPLANKETLTAVTQEHSPNRLDLSPNVLPRRSPRKLQYSPTKTGSQEIQVQLNGKSVGVVNEPQKEMESGDMDTMFVDDWNVMALEEALELEDLDLSTFQRCKVVSVEHKSEHSSQVKLKNSDGKRATCIVEGIWNSLILSPGDTVSVQAARDSNNGGWRVWDCGGMLVLQPDVLLSSTAVVGAVFCRRKAVLQERFRGLDGANKAMTIGILVHELLQLALRQRLCTVPDVQRVVEALLSSPASVRLLYDADLSRSEAQHEMNTFVLQVVRFVDEQVVNVRPDGSCKKADEWSGRVERVLDIEENVVTPQLGLKGKIDVTLQVNIHGRTGGAWELAPLELKTGRASVSAEHRGQLILYMMMMSLQAPGRLVSRGLLLYLRDIITLKVVKSGYPEQRDLLMLRNQLALYLAPKTKSKSSRNDETGSEANRDSDSVNGTAGLENFELPEPINHHACSKCAYLTLCSLYQWHTKSSDLSENHILSKLRDEALGHLSEAHIEYFLRWTALLLLEDLEKSSQNPLHHIWTVPAEERQRRGRCLSELQIADVQPNGDRFLHTFIRPTSAAAEDQKERCVLGAGEYVVVSAGGQVWVAAGVITHLDSDIVCVALERDLTERNTKETRYHVDTYESQSQLGFNLANLGALMDNDERSERLRRLIIERGECGFTERLPREVGRLGARLLKPLNLLQQRAVLRAVAARDYTLVHGMPGTGKTQTVAVLIQMLVSLGQKVLVTAHTHSAVDNVLQRLPQEMRVLRLGSSARVSPRLARCSEDVLTKHCSTPEQLRDVYESMDVVGVTCLGAGHSALSKRRYDVCVVDESTQVVQSTVLRALLAARRFVLVGDPEQLPPLVRSSRARKLGMDESVFSRLHGTAATVSLSAQYRMNRRVAALANLFTYEGQLTCATSEVRDAHIRTNLQKAKEQYASSLPWLVECLSPRRDKSVLLLDTGCTAGLRAPDAPCDAAGKTLMSNSAEALVVLAIVKAMFEADVALVDIGVITPYRDQVTLLKKCVANLQNSLSPGRRRSPRKPGNTERADGVEVNTVDQYQGRDKSVVVYSCCKTWDPEKGDYTVKDSEILEDKRRLTVAITRAKHKLIIIADASALRHYSTFSLLFQCLRKLDDDESTTSETRIEQLHLLQENLGMFL